MQSPGLAELSMHPLNKAQKDRQHAEKVAGQFESVFVRTMVSSLRQTASIGSGGMFGEGPGADTYGDWFDQNLADRISKSGHVGIKDKLMTDFENAGAIGKDQIGKNAIGKNNGGVDDASLKARNLATAANAITKAKSQGKGGFDVVL